MQNISRHLLRCLGHGYRRPPKRPIRAQRDDLGPSSCCEVLSVIKTSECGDPLGCTEDSSLELRGSVRAMIQPNAQSKYWKSLEVDEEGKDVFQWLYQYDFTESIYAANRDGGRILLARGFRSQVIFQLVGLPMLVLHDRFCIKVIKRGFLMHKSSKEGMFS